MMKFRPREKILLCLCLLCFVVWVSDSFVITSLQAQYAQSQEQYRDLVEERIHKEYSFKEFNKKADSQNSKAYIQNLQSINSELEMLYVKLGDKNSLESLISLTQLAKLKISELSLSDDGLHILVLKGNGVFAEIMKFVSHVESLRSQYISLDFLALHKASDSNAIEFEMLIQDMRVR